MRTQEAKMRLGVPTESAPGEARVAVSPESTRKLVQLGFQVLVQAGAGASASFPDALYAEAGATIVDDPWSADLVVKVQPPMRSQDGSHEADRIREGASLVCLVDPGRRPEVMEALAARRLTVLALDQVPRITRAQKMDVLSSMANIAGYRAVVEAASHFPGFFGPQMTAAGKAPPARVLVIGAGVAGLAAIGAARALGADVRAFDVRPAAREQVESMGATFLQVELAESGDGGGGYAKEMSPAFLEAEYALFRAQAREVDVVITTALIPGKPAPKLLFRDMVELMRPGGVVVDLAAANGGNCEVTVPGGVTHHGGVTIIGYTDLTCRQPQVATRFFATNVANLLEEAGGAAWRLDPDNEVLRGAMVLEQGELRWPAPRPASRPAPPSAPPPAIAAPPTAPVAVEPPAKAHKRHGHAHAAPPATGIGPWVALAVFGVLLFALGPVAPPEFLQHLTVFVLAVFIGWQVVWAVTPALHTPLMSVTNAISGIILVGGVLQAGSGRLDLASALGAVAILVASVNVVGGFVVTQRMLRMFQRE